MKPLLLGEAPSRTSDPLRPFSGATGARISALLGQALDTSYGLANLFSAYPGRAGKGTRWDGARARAQADALDLRGRDVVFVGRRVAGAFGHGRAPFLVWHADDERGFRFALLPHPSGVVRWWNEPENVERARCFLREAARGTGEPARARRAQALDTSRGLSRR